MLRDTYYTQYYRIKHAHVIRRYALKPRKGAGFTLIELITSLGMGVLILGAIIQIFLGSRIALQAGNTRAELVQNGRITLERVSRDLKQAETLVSRLPKTDTNPNLPPPNQIEFQDGHDPSTLTYIRYHQNGNGLYRELSYYSLRSAPTVRVLYDEQDDDGSAAVKVVLSDELIAEYLSSLRIWGQNPITLSLTLDRAGITTSLLTTLYGRNLD